VQIKQYAPDAVIQGLLDGEDYTNRVAGNCVYHCPHCGHQIRFRWKHFYKADEQTFLKHEYRSEFNKLTIDHPDEDEGFLDFHCPTCGAPTRLNFAIFDYTEIAYHFDLRSVFVGERLR